MQPDDSILFSKRTCWVSTVVIVVASLLSAVLISHYATRFRVRVFLLSLALSLGIIGWIAAWLCNRMMVRRLKLLYPEQKGRIEGKQWSPPHWNPVMRQSAFMPFVCEDPRAAQLLREGKRLHLFAEAWVEAPVALLFIGLAIWFLCVAISFANILFALTVAFSLFGRAALERANRAMVSRLKLRYPARSEQIEDCQPWFALWKSPVMTQAQLELFVCGDPEREQILQARNRLHTCAGIWFWASLAGILLCMALWYGAPPVRA